MKAAILRNKAMVVDEIDDLEPGPGQVLVETIACGICGSDLHTVDHGHDLVQASLDAGRDTLLFDPARDLVMGHEMSVRIIGLGAGVDSVNEGDAMAAMPMLLGTDGVHVPGYDNDYPGGYCERMLLSPEALLPIPNGLDPAVAALTEPMAVGLHAVNESAIAPGRQAVVVGAGPVGLAIIAALISAGRRPVIVSDFSPTRRALAEQLGADVIVDPAKQSVFEALKPTDATDAPVIFEAVGVPGMIDELMRTAPDRSQILVAGVCLPPDSFHPIYGIYKHLSLQFVLGWTPEEFAASLHNLAEGKIDGTAFVTGEVDLDGVPQAFRDLANPDDHVKILVRPNG